MKKLKLKGQASNKLKEKDRKKKEKTLERMQKVREDDGKYLRDIVKGKLQWANEEKQKNLQLINQIKVKIYRLEGVILLARDLLGSKKENDNNKN